MDLQRKVQQRQKHSHGDPRDLPARKADAAYAHGTKQPSPQKHIGHKTDENTPYGKLSQGRTAGGKPEQYTQKRQGYSQKNRQKQRAAFK